MFWIPITAQGKQIFISATISFCELVFVFRAKSRLLIQIYFVIREECGMVSVRGVVTITDNDRIF